MHGLAKSSALAIIIIDCLNKIVAAEFYPCLIQYKGHGTGIYKIFRAALHNFIYRALANNTLHRTDDFSHRIGQLVLAVAEVVDLEAAFFDQFVEAVIDLAEADAQLFCEVALGQARVFFQGLEQGVMGCFIKHL